MRSRARHCLTPGRRSGCTRRDLWCAASLFQPGAVARGPTTKGGVGGGPETGTVSSNQETMRTTVAAAQSKYLSDLAAAEMAAQAALNSAVGLLPGFPANSAAIAAAAASYNATRIAQRTAAEQARQVAVVKAKDTLRATGEFPA